MLFGQRERQLRYLLGEASEDERRRIEERVFADRRYFEELSALEDALINDYVCRRLSADDRARFEQHLAGSRDWQHRVTFTEALVAAAGTERAQTSPAEPSSRPVKAPPWRAIYAAAAVGTCLVLALGWLLSQLYGLRRELGAERDGRARLEKLISDQQRDEQLRAEQRRQEVAQTQRQLSELQAQLKEGAIPRASPPRVLASFFLVTGLRRNGEVPALIVPADADVRLQLDLDAIEPRSAYRARLENSAGLQVWSAVVSARSSQQPDSRYAEISMPGRLLANDQYALILSGRGASGAITDLADYHFSVRLR
jgi:hypothetical protein